MNSQIARKYKKYSKYYLAPMIDISKTRFFYDLLLFRNCHYYRYRESEYVELAMPYEEVLANSQGLGYFQIKNGW